MVDALDSAVGKVMQTLEEQGLAENTIVVFFSDNGGPNRLGANNHPLRGAKETTFEGGIRVPAFIRWPAQISKGQISSQVLTVQDLFPTLAAAARVEVKAAKPLDGKSMWGNVLGGEIVDREDLFFAVEGAQQMYLTVIHGKWKLVQIVPTSACKSTSLLFDIEADPGETRDRAGEMPDLVGTLSARIQEWRNLHPKGGIRFTSIPHPGWVAPNDWAAAARR
ncbi:MAG: sulfatase [Acidobacteriota bacterium]